MKKVKSYQDFINEAEVAEPTTKPKTKPTTTPTPTKQPGKPSPYRKDKPSVVPGPKATAKDVADKFLKLTKNNKEVQSILKNKYSKSKKIQEGLDNAESAGLYDKMSDLLDQANKVVCKHDGTDPDELIIGSPDEALELLYDIDTKEASELYDEIKSLNDEIDEIDAEEFFEDEENIEDDEYLDETYRVNEANKDI